MNWDQVEKQLCTVGDYLRWALSAFTAADLYYGHGTDNATDDSRALVLQCLNLPWDMPDVWLQCRLTDQERSQLTQALRRRIEHREPTPYITGQAWFADLRFKVTEQTLIPRSPVAELIQRQFEPWLDPAELHTVLDLCTGGGCIAAACAVWLPTTLVHGADLSANALAVAQENIQQLGLDDQVELFQGDLFGAVPTGIQYDLVISNPPYVDAAEMAALPQEYRHEPAMALAAGEDGLDLVAIMLRQAPDYLSEHGALIIEVGASEPAVAQRWPELPVTWLEFEHGGSGVFLLTAQDLRTYLQGREI